MKVTIERDNCSLEQSVCEHCFSFFAQHPLEVEPHCSVFRVEDGSADLTLTLRNQGHASTSVLDEAERQKLEANGWSPLIDSIFWHHFSSSNPRPLR